MNVLKVIALALIINSAAISQSAIVEKDLIGTWTATVNQNNSERTKMMFDGMSVALNADYSFTGTLMVEFSGNWKIEKESVILESSGLPESIVLSDISKDSCIWKLDAMDAIINFYKNHENKDSSSLADTVIVVKVERDDLIGHWNNTLIGFTNKTEKQNSFLFGSRNDDMLILDESGQFSLTESSNTKMTRKIFEGTWFVENGVVVFENEAIESERLGITKFNQDSLVLVNMELWHVPLGGKTRVRFTHTKVKEKDIKK